MPYALIFLSYHITEANLSFCKKTITASELKNLMYRDKYPAINDLISGVLSGQV